MAISTGFPPSNTIGASVRIAEKDLSFVTEEQSFHRAGIVGFASKGPINQPTLVSSVRDLYTKFGFPHPDTSDPYLIYAGIQYLQVASELMVVRVADTDAVSDESAKTAEVDTLAAGTVVEIISDLVGDGSSDYTFAEDSFFRWRLNGVLSSKTLVVLADDNRDAPYTGDPYTAAELADDLNAQLDDTFDGIEFFATDDSKIGVRTIWAYGPDASLELVSVQNAIYGGAVLDGNPTGLGTGMTQATRTGSAASYPTTGSAAPAGTYDFTGLTNLNIQLVIDGTDNVLVDNVVQVIDLVDLEGSSNSISAIVTEINSQRASEGGSLPGGWECEAVGNNLSFHTLHHGRDARLLVKSESTAGEIFGFSNLTAKGESPTRVTGDADVYVGGRISGDDNTGGDISFTFMADSPGIEGNNTQIIVKNNTQEGNFTINVYSNGVQVESWGQLTKDTTSRFYIESYLELVSNYVRVSDNTDVNAPPADGTYTLTGGTDGIPSDPDLQDALVIGNPIGFTGLYTLSEPESIEIDLLAAPGRSSTAVVVALIEICRDYRQDCLAIIDPPFGLAVQEIVDWQNGTHPLNLTRFDSDFAAMYWPWLKMYDVHNRVDVWVPPSGSVMATIARNDQIEAPWWAPAGLTRGIVNNISGVFNQPTAAERDLLYGYRNCVNPILTFNDGSGFYVWGQKTMQRRATALDRINVRRMLFVAEKRIRVAARNILFDQHDSILRQKFVNLARVILEDIQVQRGITAFKIQCDEKLNTPDVIDRNELRARIGIQPTRAAEFIFIEFSVHRTGSFDATSDTF